MLKQNKSDVLLFPITNIKFINMINLHYVIFNKATLSLTAKNLLNKDRYYKPENKINLYFQNKILSLKNIYYLYNSKIEL